MKTLWCVGLVLLLAVEAGAVDYWTSSNTWNSVEADSAYLSQEQIGRVIVMSANGWKEWPKPLTCEQRMEAAMRAMEPLAFGKPGTAQEFLEALRLFNAAKRDCWRTP